MGYHILKLPSLPNSHSPQFERVYMWEVVARKIFYLTQAVFQTNNCKSQNLAPKTHHRFSASLENAKSSQFCRKKSVVSESRSLETKRRQIPCLQRMQWGWAQWSTSKMHLYLEWDESSKGRGELPWAAGGSGYSFPCLSSMSSGGCEQARADRLALLRDIFRRKENQTHLFVGKVSPWPAWWVTTYLSCTLLHDLLPLLLPQNPTFPTALCRTCFWQQGLGSGVGVACYCECVLGCPGWEVRGTLGSWAAETMFEGQGMELLLTIVQTSAGTPSCLQGTVTQGSLIITNIYNTTVLAVSYGNSSSC